VTSAVADNIHYAADNITSVVASAYSVFRQKTFEMQVSMKRSCCDSCTKGPHKNKSGSLDQDFSNRCQLFSVSTARSVIRELCQALHVHGTGLSFSRSFFLS
jgi:hypothetical protein